MISSLRNKVLLPLVIAVIILTTRGVLAGIRLSDDVGSVDKCRLSAVTTGRFFPAGGRLVTFYMDGSRTGRSMSGGDGFAFLKCEGLKSGLHKVRAESGEDSATAYLLLAGPETKLLLIHIDDILMGSLFNSRGGDKRKPASLKGLAIVYVTSLPSGGTAHRILREHGYPDAPVIDWAGGQVIDELRSAGVSVYALVAPASVLTGVQEVNRKFSFDDAEGAERINDWDDLRKKW